MFWVWSDGDCWICVCVCPCVCVCGGCGCAEDEPGVLWPCTGDAFVDVVWFVFELFELEFEFELEGPSVFPRRRLVPRVVLSLSPIVVARSRI